jgi:hypothetical protein
VPKISEITIEAVDKMVVISAGQKMGVPLKRRGWLRMPELRSDVGDRRTAVQQERSVSVPTIVEPEPAQLRRLENAREGF